MHLDKARKMTIKERKKETFNEVITSLCVNIVSGMVLRSRISEQQSFITHIWTRG